MRRTLSLLISVIMAVSVIFAGTVMSASAESVKYSVDISKLTTNEGKAIVMNGYTDASYATGTYVINFKGVGEACISLGNIDLSKYDTVSMTIGASANAVFDNNGKVAKVAFTSNGAAVTGNKDDGFKSVAGANIIAESNLMPPPGRYGAGEQVVEIALNSSYSGEIFLNYCPSPRDNGGKKTAFGKKTFAAAYEKKAGRHICGSRGHGTHRENRKKGAFCHICSGLKANAPIRRVRSAGS